MNAATLAHAGDASDASDASVPPARIGDRYEVMGLLGSGGMGTVYRVRDLHLDVVVALKLLRGDWTSPDAVEQFRQEVRLARRVTHRNVVRTFDAGEHGGERFVTLELIEGESLATRLRRDGRLDVPHALACAREIAAGLAAAHAVGVVHLDLKPGNVLAERRASGAPAGGGLPPDLARLAISDFGLSRTADAPRVRGVVGTPAFMAPEQVEGAADLDARADVYAFGALLYALLTGHSAWQGASALDVASARLAAPPPDPRAHRPDLPDALATAVSHMMARAPGDRPSDGGALVAALDALAAQLVGPVGGAVDPDSVRQRAQRVAPTAHAVRAVAVLPARIIPDDDLLADELTEDLIDRLSMTRALRVRPYATTKAACPPGRDARDAGRALEVEAVVALTVRRQGDAARVSARALGIADGFQLWAQRFESTTQELLALNDHIAAAVASVLSLRDADVDAAAPRAPMTAPHALEIYVAARAALRQAWTGLRPFAPVLALFEQALALAPEDAMVLSGAAMARARAANFNQAGPEARDQARALADHAIALAPGAAEPWFARASLDHVEGDWVRAAGALRRALALAPAYLPAQLMLGSILGEVGPLDEASLRFDVVRELDPASPYPSIVQSQLHALAGRLDDAVEAFPRAATDAEASTFAVYAARANLWLGAPRLPVVLGPGASPAEFAARAFGAPLRGEPVPFDTLEQRIAATPARTRFLPLLLQFVTELRCAVGQADEALDALERAVDAQLYDWMWLDGCPVLAPLRAHPRFAAARARVVERASAVRAALSAPLAP